jgi:hypothetical protein
MSKGISRQFTVPYSLQQNGIFECRNRSILDITRCMLLDKNLPHHLWGEAVRAACILLNLRSTKHSHDKTPFELFYGQKPSVANLCVFGSQVFVHQTHQTEGKLGSHSQEGVLLSHDTQAKGWYVYIPGQRHVIITRDVKIIESLADTIDYDTSASPNIFSRFDIAPAFSSLAFLAKAQLPATPMASPIDYPLNKVSPLAEQASPEQDSLPIPTSPDQLHLATYHRRTTSSLPTDADLPTLRRSTRLHNFPSHLQAYAAACELSTPMICMV